MKQLTMAESYRKLSHDHGRFCSSCCPEVPEFADRVEKLEEIVGVHPVYAGAKEKILNRLSNLSTEIFSDHVREYVRHIIHNATEEEFRDNVIRDNKFTELQTRIEAQGRETEVYYTWSITTPEDMKFKLIKRSPKISVLLASIAKHAGKDPERDDLIKWYNDRGAKPIEDLEFVVSTEPHRIAGMSAYGDYTSCQDWRKKKKGHDYHNYTHQSWANLNDPTVGVLFIRFKNDENDVDMLARSLVRVMPLKNGQVVVYAHRIYGQSPYSNYMIPTIQKWAESLPKNYHVIEVFDGESLAGKNAHGVEYSHGTWIKFRVNEDIPVYGSNTEQCDCCDGEGHNECNCCDGSGKVWSNEEVECSECYGSGTVECDLGHDHECSNCDGSGYIEEEVEIECDECYGSGSIECDRCHGEGQFENDDEEYYPYNDHSNYFEFYHDHISFNVPDYLLQWDYNPHHVEEELNDEEIA